MKIYRSINMLSFKFLVHDVKVEPDEFTVASGEEFDVKNFTVANKVFDYGVIRCHGNCVITASGKLKICANSVFRFVR